MSVAFATCCVECGVKAPEIGDSGHIGRPGLEPTRRRGEPQNFGYIYEGFKALSILTPELESFRAFLEAHGEHRLATSSDHGPVEGDVKDWPRKPKAFRGNLGRFKSASYQVECGDCSTSWSSPTIGQFRGFKPFHLSESRLELFRRRVLDVDGDNFYRIGDPILDPGEDLGRLGGFVVEHAGHTLTARLVPAPSSPIPPALL